MQTQTRYRLGTDSVQAPSRRKAYPVSTSLAVTSVFNSDHVSTLPYPYILPNPPSPTTPLQIYHLGSCFEFGLRLGCPPLLCILPILSNRLHLYNVRVLSMDLVTSVLTLASARLITFQRPGAGCALLGMSLAFKLNSVLFLPGRIHDSLGLGFRIHDSLVWSVRFYGR